MPICSHIQNRLSLAVSPAVRLASPTRSKKGAEYSSHPRERWFRCVRSLILVWLSATSFQGFAAAPEVKEAELKQIQGRIESVRKAIQSDAERRDALTKDLRAADLRIQSARERLTDVRAQRADAEGQLAALRDEKSKTQQQVDAQREALSAELAVAYMNGREEELKLLLNQQDPAQLGRMIGYYGYLGRARADRIGEINDHLAHLNLLDEQIAAQTAELKQLEYQRQKEVEALNGARRQRATTLAQVQTKLRSRSDELAKLQSDAKALEKLIDELRRAAEEFPDLGEQPFAKVRGRLPWPVKGALLARFGQLRAGGPLKWQGWVIASNRGTQVRAPYPGRVVYSDWLPGLGLLIVLDHGGGYMTLYGHNEQLFRKVGDRVKAGDVLSAVGDAAGFGQTGLYVEIRKGKEALNPADWLAKK
jgi:septal ring factor EnvC (AmiA/AmiB activator)